MKALITKNKFAAFERVRKEGRFNMMMHANYAADAADLTMDEYREILNRYEELLAKWPEARK